MPHRFHIFSIIFSCAFLLPETGFSNKKLTENYISAYKDIAIAEMKRTGIPASIKLAQGILESDLGRSPLAIEANNHFGIKCGGDWNGEVFLQHDDDTDSSGTIIESCFRSYISAAESYIAHSDFLSNPSKQSRYGFLFALGSTDYVGWANGLKFSGYASDPTYPSKLIKIIESNKLYLYDEPVDSKIFVNNNNTTKFETETNQKTKSSEPQIVKADQNSRQKVEKQNKESSSKVPSSPVKSSYVSGRINDLAVVFASGNEAVKDIARRTENDIFDILEYNEGLQSQDYVPNYKEIVFLEKKKKNINSDGPQEHIVTDGENMYSISQTYGIRLESLLAKNNLSTDALPYPGEKISLIHHLSKKDTPRHKFVEKFDSFVDLGGLQ